MGVCAIALFFIPGLAAPFRLAKWALWGAVLAVMAIRHGLGPGFSRSPIPRNLPVFFASAAFTAWSVLTPFFSTPFTTVHTAGSLLMVMGFGFSWLSALELQAGEPRTRWHGLFMLGLGGSLVSILVFLQASGLTLPGTVPALTREFRAIGTLGNPNWTAGFLLALPPLLLGVRSWLSTNKISRHFQAACLIMAPLTACATVATGSKAGILALAAGFGAFILFDSRVNPRHRGLAVAGTGLALSVAGANLWLSGRLHQLPWTRGRLFLWESAAALSARHPLTGIGLGGFPAGYPQAIPVITGGDPQAFMPLHRVEFAYNDLLQFAVEAGIPSALFYVTLVFLVLRQALKSGDGLSRGVGAAMAAMTVYGCFDSPLQLPGTLALWWFLAGWMMAGAPEAPSAQELRKKTAPWGPRFLSAGLLLLGLFQAARFSAAEVFWTLGSSSLTANQTGPASIHMEKAAALNPENALLLSEAALAYDKNGDSGKALDMVDRALSAGFSFDDLYLRQKVLAQQGNPWETAAEWKRMARDYPGLFAPHLELGRMHLDRGEFRQARIEFERVLAIRQREDLDRAYHGEAERLIDQIPGPPELSRSEEKRLRGK